MIRFLLILFCFIPFFGVSQVDLKVYINTFGGLANDIGEEIQETSDGGYIIIGSTATNGDGNTDVYLLKIDSLCNYEWSKALGESNNDWAYSIKQTYDNGFIIAGASNSYGNGDYDAFLMKRDPQGKYEWLKTYGGNDWDFSYSIIQTYDSGYVFCGETYNNTNGYSDVYIVKTNSMGDTIWTKVLGGPFMDRANSLIQTSDSNIVVVGNMKTLNDSNQAYVLKLTNEGVLLWDSLYGYSKYETANHVLELPNGNYAVVGSSNSLSTNEDLDSYYLLLDSDGNKIIDQILVNLPPLYGENEELNSIALLSSSTVLVTGYTETFGGGAKDGLAMILDYDGYWVNSTTYGDLDNEIIHSTIIDSKGTIVSVGQTNSFTMGLNDVLVIKSDTLFAGQDTMVTIHNDLIPIGVENLENDDSFNIYPNPTNHYLNIQFNNNKFSDVKFELYNLVGENVFQKQLNNNLVLDISFLSSQIYYYRILHQEKILSKGKLVIH